LPRISLFADWVARIVSADTVAAMLDDALVLVLELVAPLAVAAVEFVPDVELDAFDRLARREAWLLLLMLPIDIMCFCFDRWNQVVGWELENFRGGLFPAGRARERYRRAH
jgi:hypothetical protein